jgi:hypothetical protein
LLKAIDFINESLMLFKFESTKNTCKFGQLKDRETKIIYQKKKKNVWRQHEMDAAVMILWWRRHPNSNAVICNPAGNNLIIEQLCKQSISSIFHSNIVLIPSICAKKSWEIIK